MKRNKLLKKTVAAITAGGRPEKEAWALAVAAQQRAGQVRKGRLVLTKKGQRRSGRADVRAFAAAALSDAKKEAGNYAKPKVRWAGFEVAIETPKGTERSGKDASGKPWSVTMPVDYGYLKKTLGVDGDHVDVFLGPVRDVAKAPTVWVLEQKDKKTGKFDEHKLLAGFASKAQGLRAYLKSFSDDARKRVGKLTAVPAVELKAWLREQGLARRSLRWIEKEREGMKRNLKSEKPTAGERARGALVGATAGTALLGTLGGSKANVKVPNAVLKKLRMKPGRLKGGKGKVTVNPARIGGAVGALLGGVRPPQGKAQEIADAGSGYVFVDKSFGALVAAVRELKEDKPFAGYNPKRHARTGGLNDRFRERYNRETGSNLKRPVTTPPSKLKPGGKAAGRRKSFCGRMSGVKGPTSKDGKLTPKGAALKRWNCGELSALRQAVRELMTATEEQKVRRKAGLASDAAKAAYYGTGAVATAMLARKGMKVLDGAAKRQRAVARSAMKRAAATDKPVRDILKNVGQASRNAVPVSEAYGDLGRAYVGVKRRVQLIGKQFKRGWQQGQRAAMKPAAVAERKAKAAAKARQQRAVNSMPRFFELRAAVRELYSGQQLRYDATVYNSKGEKVGHRRKHNTFIGAGDAWLKDLPTKSAGDRTVKPSLVSVAAGEFKRAQRLATPVQRGGKLIRDVADTVTGTERRDSSGRKVKKEWDKQWFKKAATSAALAAGGVGLLGARKWARGAGRKTKLGSRIRGAEEGLRRGVDNAERLVEHGLNRVANRAGLGDPAKPLVLRRKVKLGGKKIVKMPGAAKKPVVQGGVPPKAKQPNTKPKVAAKGKGQRAKGKGKNLSALLDAVRELADWKTIDQREDERNRARRWKRRGWTAAGVGASAAILAHQRNPKVVQQTPALFKDFKLARAVKRAGGKASYRQVLTQNPTAALFAGGVGLAGTGASVATGARGSEAYSQRKINERRKANAAKGKNLSALLDAVRELAPPVMVGWDPYYSAPGWDVRDARGKSARVFAPGSRKRVRRPKEWHEKVDNIKRMGAAAAVAGVAGGLTVGHRVGSGRWVPAKYAGKRPVKRSKPKPPPNVREHKFG